MLMMVGDSWSKIVFHELVRRGTGVNIEQLVAASDLAPVPYVAEMASAQLHEDTQQTSDNMYT